MKTPISPTPSSNTNHSHNGNGYNGASPPVLSLPTLPWPQNQENEWDLQRFLRALQRRSWIIVGVSSAIVSLAAAATMYQKPVYESQFRLLVEPVNAANDLGSLTEALGSATSGSAVLNQSALDYETQIQVLRSPELMSKALKRIQANYPDLDYDTLIKNLTIARPDETKILEVRYRATDPTEIQLTLDLLSEVYLDYSLAERQTNLRQGIQFIDKQLPRLQQQVDQLQGSLQNFRERYNFVDPQQQTTAIATKAANLDNQRLEVEQELAKARSYFTTLQDETGGVAALGQAEVYQQLVGELRQVETEIASELTRFNEGNINIRVLQEKRDNLLPLLRQEAQRVLGSKLAESATEIQVLEVQSQTIAAAQADVEQQVQQLPTLSRQYADLQRELQIATDGLSRLLENRQTLQVKAAQTEIPWQIIQAPSRPEQPISPSLRRNLLMGIVAGLLLGLGIALILEKLDNVYHSIDDLKETTKLPILGTLPPTPELTKNLSTINGLPYITDGLAYRSGMFNAVDRAPSHGASSHGAASPSASVYGASAYGANSYGASFDSASFDSASAHHLNSRSMASFTEALRILYTNIQVQGNNNRPIRAITVSSAIPGEGSSIVAAYLAQVAVSMGRRVLLVDSDLRRPQIHNYLNLSNQRGLTSLFAMALPIKNAIQQPIPGLFVMTAGEIPADPTRLLSSIKMQQLMEQFYKTFDLVIYDTPPLLGLADASVLAPYTDGLILVTRLGKTDRSALTQALASLKLSNTRVLGMVANGVPSAGLATYRRYL